MNKIKTQILLAIFLLTSTLAFSQASSNSISLPLFGLKSQSMETIMYDIDRYIGNKPNGLRYPITKIVFSQYDDVTCFEVVAIDNAWNELFKFGETPYGYIILANRLFLVAVEGYNKIDLNPIFYVIDQSKSFNRALLGSPVPFKKPKWFFELRDGDSFLVSTSELEAFD